MKTLRGSASAATHRRATLSRQGILEAALALIDANGLDAFNMRELGIALKASPMSVYRHFRDKAELIDAVVDGIVARFVPSEIYKTWQDQARALSVRVRASMLEHPELAFIIGHELRRSPESLRVNTTIIARLRITGVPERLLGETYWALSSYTTGYALLEAQTYRHRRGRVRSQKQRARKLAAMLGAVEGLSENERDEAADVMARPLDDRQFLFGLDCVIRGLEQQIGNVRPTRKPR
ncbi:MAG TPA: TetR/AcrR family transcriptional regulator C-terminal domain-containing protein [Rhizomicrobium sp.]|jgi:AcrR family transcriptional regulator